LTDLAIEPAEIGTVGIIGAEVSGLVTAKTLMAEGLRCTVLERGSVLGGVWADGYSNFGVQVQKELYEYPDWPLPDEVDSFAAGPDLRNYLQGYADHFGVTPHIQLGCEVTEVRERGDGRPGWTLAVHDKTGQREYDFDLVVVCVGLYSDVPHRSEFADQASFSGKVLHVSQVRSREPLEGRRVAVLGFGKSATDMVLESAAVAEETHIILREPHWPVPRKLAGVLAFKWGLLSRMTTTLLPLYQHPTAVECAIHRLGRPLVWLWWRLVEVLLRLQHGLGREIEDGANLVPDEPIDIDAFGESTMLPRPAFYRAIGDREIRAHRSTVRGFTPAGIELAKDRVLEIDLMVLATGWRTGFDCLTAKLRETLGFEEDGVYLYRHILHPEAPRLAFVGQASTISSMLTYSLQARWLAELVVGRSRLPDREAMASEIEDMKRWKRSWLPASAARGARLIAHMQHYHDELLRDFGADPLRKRGIFGPFKELMVPYQPADYRDIASGAWARSDSKPGSTERRGPTWPTV
jgi:dimethylaniline monooxygenase (N-oxide forming)